MKRALWLIWFLTLLAGFAIGRFYGLAVGEAMVRRLIP